MANDCLNVCRILIDTGEGRPSWIKAIQDVLVREKAECFAILTHRHMDHVGGVIQLKELCPEVKIYKHSPDQGHCDIKDSQIFKVEGATLRAVHTPGFVFFSL
jgi:ribonuclease/clavin/mitogillin